MNKHGQECDLKHLIAIVEKCKSQFQKIHYKLGEQRANIYLMFLNKRIKGEEDSNFKKLVKFKTLKRTHIETVKAADHLLEKNILNDDDIRLFVDIIEDDENDKNDRIRYNSVSLHRSSHPRERNDGLSAQSSISDL